MLPHNVFNVYLDFSLQHNVAMCRAFKQPEFFNGRQFSSALVCLNCVMFRFAVRH